MANEAFVWGRAGRKLTPDQVAQEREAAALLAQGAMDYSPVAHWSQGLNRVAQGLLAGIDYRMADKAEADIAGVNKDLIASLLGGSAPAPAADTATSIPMTSAADEVSATSPGLNVDPAIRDGIVQTASALGVEPVDLATAISYETAGTFDPTKTGPTTKWGTHRGLIQFGEPQAQQYGVNWDDPIGSQLGENGAVANYLRSTGVKPGMGLLDIYSAINAGGVGRYNASDAAAGGAPGTVRDKVEQQMADHRAKALALLGQGAAPQADTPEAAIEAIAPSAASTLAPALDAPREVASMPVAEAIAATAQAPVQVAQASGANPAIIAALTNPQATPQTQRIAAMLLQQEQEKQQMAEEQRLQAADPLRQLQIRKAQQELERGQPLVNAGDGAVYNPNTNEWLRAPNAAQKPPQVVELFDEATGQPYKATWNAEKGEYERVGGVKARSGMQLTTNPDGTVTLTEGAIGGLPKLTEAEGRNSGFYGRGVESHKILNDLEGEGTSLMNKVAGSIPIAGNYLRSEDAQKYDQAKRDYINAVLRRESGAVISPEEFKNAEQQYFPQPGDGPEVIEQKRRNRETTIQGLKISAGQGAAFAVPSDQAPQKKRLKFNPATGELE
ncbi:hypothetical protein [Sinorhizobium medicae]